MLNDFQIPKETLSSGLYNYHRQNQNYIVYEERKRLGRDLYRSKWLESHISNQSYARQKSGRWVDP